MKTSKQVAWLTAQIMLISLGLMYVWGFAADLVTEKEDVANVIGFAIYIAVIAALIIGCTYYVKKFQKLFATKPAKPAKSTPKETPDAPKPE